MRREESARVQIRWCFAWRSVALSPQEWGPSLGGHRGGSNRWWRGQRKEYICCSVFEWGTKNGLDFSAQFVCECVCVYINIL